MRPKNIIPWIQSELHRKTYFQAGDKCKLLIFNRQGLPKQHRLVKIIGGYCIFGYILIIIFFLSLWCKPVQQYWQVPVDNGQCASYYHHIIYVSVFNISSDLNMLLIPLPLLIKAHLPLKRKLILCCVFSLGIFVILAAVLNRYYNFTAPYGSLIYLNWYAGEAATAVMVANIPHCWPALGCLFHLGKFKPTSRRVSASSGHRYDNPPRSVASSNKRRNEKHHGVTTRSESTERIARISAGSILTKTPPSGNAGLSPAQSEQHLELGLVVPNQHYVGTEVTASGAREDSWDRKAHLGTIVKTVSVKQTYSDHVNL